MYTEATNKTEVIDMEDKRAQYGEDEIITLEFDDGVTFDCTFSPVNEDMWTENGRMYLFYPRAGGQRLSLSGTGVSGGSHPRR